MIQHQVKNTEQLSKEGFQLIRSVFDGSECNQFISQLEKAMAGDATNFHFRESRGKVFAARNLIQQCPELASVWKRPVLIELLNQLLGPKFGLVRVLYFDKPSDRSWSLPFHKDMTIAVKDNSLASKRLTKPTNKAGVGHVEADEQLLEQMLTLRIHLDRVTEDNGPLQVIPGSHLNGKQSSSSDSGPVKVLCDAGDVLAMRPLISHGSSHSNPDLEMRRRILHFEFCGVHELPDGFQWHHFSR